MRPTKSSSGCQTAHLSTETFVMKNLARTSLGRFWSGCPARVTRCLCLNREANGLEDRGALRRNTKFLAEKIHSGRVTQ